MVSPAVVAGIVVVPAAAAAVACFVVAGAAILPLVLLLLSLLMLLMLPQFAAVLCVLLQPEVAVVAVGIGVAAAFHAVDAVAVFVVADTDAQVAALAVRCIRGPC